MNDNIFREYDIRGIVGDELPIDQAYDLGQAIVTFLKKKHPHLTTMVVGRDGRTHSLPITKHLMKAFIDHGLDVIDIGIVPTPVVYFAVHFFNTPGGVCITASHNPKEYNGVKMWAVWGKEIQEIKKIYHEKAFRDTSDKKGSIKDYAVITDYINYLTEKFAHLKNAKLDVVIDCGNGTAGTVFPELVEKMNWGNVKLLFTEVDGTFPHHEADPTVKKNMLSVKGELDRSSWFKFGLGLDGDCDRMAPMTRSGFLVPGDQLLALYAQKVLQNNPKATVVFDIKSSGSLTEVLTKLGANPVMSPSGHSIIKEQMIKHKALLAGELSCHFFFADRYFGYDDGIYAAMRLFEIMEESKETLETLIASFPVKVSSPEFRIPCICEEDKGIIVEHVKNIFAARTDAAIITIDGIRAQMAYGWGLVRASNTQNVICLRFESETKDGLKKVKQDFFEALVPYFEKKKLKEGIDL
ncbi:phosphomannomutase/phosphoglucomutase [Candidatus Babeliales bacterium]|nr:phosphomannomutase/phosphoglucomutase [Candidatus Babeliales bacterium]